MPNVEVFCLKFPNLSPRTSQPELYQTILQELRVLCHPVVSEHENIIKLLGLDFMEDYDDYQLAWPVLAMEYGDYGSLNDYRQNILLDDELTCELLLDVALGLDALHRCNIVHGDVKSENVLICRHPRRKVVAKLSDFGLAVINPATNKLHNLPGGTWPWMAPEAYRQLTVEGLKLADVFSYGLTAWHIFVNQSNPFDILNRSIVDDPATRDPAVFVAQAKSSDTFVDSVIQTISPRRSVLITELSGTVLRSTLQGNPEYRDLGKAISALAASSTRCANGYAPRII
jgi:serine/threonine protein kinase